MAAPRALVAEMLHTLRKARDAKLTNYLWRPVAILKFQELERGHQGVEVGEFGFRSFIVTTSFDDQSTDSASEIWSGGEQSHPVELVVVTGVEDPVREP